MAVPAQLPPRTPNPRSPGQDPESGQVGGVFGILPPGLYRFVSPSLSVPVQGEQESILTLLPVELRSWGAKCYAVWPMIVVSFEANLGCVSLNTASTLRFLASFLGPGIPHWGVSPVGFLHAWLDFEPCQRWVGPPSRVQIEVAWSGPHPTEDQKE